MIWTLVNLVTIDETYLHYITLHYTQFIKQGRITRLYFIAVAAHEPSDRQTDRQTNIRTLPKCFDRHV